MNAEESIVCGSMNELVSCDAATCLHLGYSRSNREKIQGSRLRSDRNLFFVRGWTDRSSRGVTGVSTVAILGVDALMG